MLVATNAEAQRSRFTLDAGGSAVRYADSLDLTTTTLAPALVVMGTRGAVAVNGSFSQLSGGAWSHAGSVGGTVSGPALGAFGTEFVGSVGGSAHRDGARTGQWLGIGQVVLDRSSRGGWAGGGFGGTWDGFSWRRVAQASVGGWFSRAATSVAASLAPTAVDDSVRYSDLHLRVRHSVGRFDLGGSIGGRRGDPAPGLVKDAVWGSVSATAWVRTGVGIVASAGTYPVDYTQGFPGGRFLAVSARFTAPRARSVIQQAGQTAAVLHGDARSFDLRRVREGTYRLRIHAPRARQAELMGDFTNWVPVTLNPDDAGWWSVDLPLAPGTYQLNVRFDGGRWRVPPGLIAVTDEFGGAAGLLIVP